MFKKHISKWGLNNKRLRRCEALRIQQLKSQRDALGKQSRIFVGGRQIEWSNVKRHLSRHRSTAANAASSGKALTSSSTPAEGNPCKDIVLRTPSPDQTRARYIFPVPRSLHLDGELLAADQLGRIISNYAVGSLENKMWVVQGGELRVAKPTADPRAVIQWYNLGRTAARLISSGNISAGFTLMGYWLDSARRVLVGQHPHFIRITINVLGYHLQHKDKDLESALLREVERHLADVSKVVLGERHPISLGLARLRDKTRSDLLRMGSFAFGPVLDRLEPILGSSSASLAEIRRHSLWWQDLSPEMLARRLQAILVHLTSESTAYQRLQVELEISGLLADAGQAIEAREIIERASRSPLLARGQMAMTERQRELVLSLKQADLRLQLQTKRYEGAARASCGLLRFAEVAYGPYHEATIDSLRRHCETLRLLGRDRESVQVAKILERRCHRIQSVSF